MRERKRESRKKKKNSSWIVEWRSQGEEGISLCSSAGAKKDRKKWVRKRVWARERENTQAKCLMWITLGQTSEEDKTANMSHCSLLAFSNRCLVSPSPVIVTRPGWSDPANDVFLINIYLRVACCCFFFLNWIWSYFDFPPQAFLGKIKAYYYFTDRNKLIFGHQNDPFWCSPQRLLDNRTFLLWPIFFTCCVHSFYSWMLSHVSSWSV